MKFFNLRLAALFLFILFVNANLKAQDEIKIKLTLEEAIDLARQQSVEAFRVKNMYLARYWDYRSYIATLRPSLNLNSDLFNYRNTINKRWDPETGEYYAGYKGFTNDLSVSVNQTVPWTGGSIYVRSSLERTQDLTQGVSYFAANPIWRVGISQPLNGYNEMYWTSKIEPMKFEKAKLQYLQGLESLSSVTVSRFFGIVSSQINLDIANNSYANADTLYRIAKGRFEIGTITQDELLDLELSLLNAKINLSKSKMDLKRAQNELNAYLKLDKDIVIECVVPDKIPSLKLNFEKVYQHALERNPTLLDYKQSLLEQDQLVASRKAQNGFDGTLTANFGTIGNAELLPDTYVDPDQSQNVSLNFELPLVDWGRRKGRYLMAKSNREATRAQIEQNLVQFEQDLMVRVMEFNLQEEQVEIAMKADSTAYLGYDITKKRFYIDKVDVIKLNSARASLSSAKRSYISALRSYWSYYFEIRETTLYDFVNNKSLEEDFDELLQQQRY